MLVSITVPTWNREHRLPALHAQFERQTWAGGDLELVVLDDSPEPSPYFASIRSERVKYHHDPVRSTVGAKRARLLELARGECHIQFDDDDFYAPTYVERTLANLGDHDFFHYNAWHLYRESDRTIWYWDTRKLLEIQYVLEGGGADPAQSLRDLVPHKDLGNEESRAAWIERTQWGFGFSYAYRSEPARKAGFPDVTFGEDYQFVKRMRALGARMRVAPDEEGLCVHVLQVASTSRCFPQFRLPNHVGRHIPALDALRFTLPG